MVDELRRAATNTYDTARSAPLALALLFLNAGFLIFGGYVIGELAANTAARDKAQFELIEKLINATVECRTPLPHLTPPPITTLPK